MTGAENKTMQCPEFDQMLAEALDESLTGAAQERFTAHRESCAACAELFAEARTGMSLLRSLEEVEPPVHMVRNILAATTGLAPTLAVEKKSPWQQVKEFFVPAGTAILQPRFAMSFGMAFFSMSLMLNVLGVDVRGIKNIDLRPTALKNTAVRQYYATTGRLVRFYENLRIVYEVESQVKELKQNSAGDKEQEPAPAEQQPEQKPPTDPKNRTDKDNQQQQNYVLEIKQRTLAAVEPDPAGDGMDPMSKEKNS